MPEMKKDARLNFRINSELKKTIEDAAAQTFYLKFGFRSLRDDPVIS